MKKYALLFVVVLLLVPLMVTSAQEEGETIILSTSYDMTILNPVLATDGGSIDVYQFIYANLIEFDPVTGAPLPGLASWEISEDGLTYTLTIRDDANWSDGTPITANDVKFTFEAIKRDDIESPRKGNVALMEELNVIDDKTFEIVFATVDCTVWGNLAVLDPVPAHKFAEDFSDFMTSDFNTAPDIASGPYIFDQHEPDEFTRLRANESYFKGAPEIEYLIRRVLPDPAVQNQALVTGDIDYAFMYPDEVAQIPSLDGLATFSFALHNTPILALNWADPENPSAAFDEEGNRVEQAPHPIFSDVRVRQAVVMGYDKDAILSTLGEGNGARLTSSVIPALTWAYNDSLTPWPYDPDRAAELLDEAGWTDSDGDGIRDKDGMPLAFTLTYSPGVTDLWDNIALVAQDQLSQLGMDVTLEPLEWGAFLNDLLLPQTFDALVVGFGGGANPDPDGIAGNIMDSANDIPGSGFNMTSYVNERVDELLAQGKSIPGCATEDRAPIYFEMQEITQSEVAYDFTVNPNQVHVMNERVLNFDPGTWVTFWNTEEFVIGE
jgi:peptide/nickel transport system substrate-binding protein